MDTATAREAMQSKTWVVYESPTFTHVVRVIAIATPVYPGDSVQIRVRAGNGSTLWVEPEDVHPL